MTPKIIHLISYSLMVFAISCNENSTSPVPSHSTLKGKIEGWHSEGYDSLDLKVGAQTIAQAPVDSSGHFEVNSPFPTPDGSLLRQFSSRADSNLHWRIIDHRAFSDSTMKYAPLEFVGYTRHHIGFDLYSGNNFLITDSGTSIGDFMVSFFYFNKPGTFTGSYILTFQDSILIRQFGHTEVVTNCDLDFKAGWNAVTTAIDSDDSYRRVYSVSISYPTKTKWFIGWTISYNFALAA